METLKSIAQFIAGLIVVALASVGVYYGVILVLRHAYRFIVG